MKHMSNVSTRVLCVRLHCSSLALFNIKLSHPCASAPTRGEACSRVSTPVPDDTTVVHTGSHVHKLMISMTEGKRLPVGCDDVQRSRMYSAGRLMRYEICKLEPVRALCNNRPRWSSKRQVGKRGCEKHNTTVRQNAWNNSNRGQAVPVRAHNWWPAQPEEAPWSPARGCGLSWSVVVSQPQSLHRRTTSPHRCHVHQSLSRAETTLRSCPERIREASRVQLAPPSNHRQAHKFRIR